jgi:hypothetical protein
MCRDSLGKFALSRHCERSEAIQRRKKSLDCFAALAMTELAARNRIGNSGDRNNGDGITVTVHLTSRAFLRRRPAAWFASSISRSVGPSCPARAAQFVEALQPDATCPVPFAKIFPFTFDANHFYVSRHPGPHKGAFRDRHGRKVGMRWTRAALLTRAPGSRTVKSCGPDAPTLASSW